MLLLRVQSDAIQLDVSLFLLEMNFNLSSVLWSELLQVSLQRLVHDVLPSNQRLADSGAIIPQHGGLAGHLVAEW